MATNDKEKLYTYKLSIGYKHDENGKTIIGTEAEPKTVRCTEHAAAPHIKAKRLKPRTVRRRSSRENADD